MATTKQNETFYKYDIFSIISMIEAYNIKNMQGDSQAPIPEKILKELLFAVSERIIALDKHRKKNSRESEIDFSLALKKLKNIQKGISEKGLYHPVPGNLLDGLTIADKQGEDVHFPKSDDVWNSEHVTDESLIPLTHSFFSSCTSLYLALAWSAVDNELSAKVSLIRNKWKDETKWHEMLRKHKQLIHHLKSLKRTEDFKHMKLNIDEVLSSYTDFISNKLSDRLEYDLSVISKIRNKETEKPNLFYYFASKTRVYYPWALRIIYSLIFHSNNSPDYKKKQAKEELESLFLALGCQISYDDDTRSKSDEGKLMLTSPTHFNDHLDLLESYLKIYS
jgi:hypothetical protein